MDEFPDKHDDEFPDEHYEKYPKKQHEDYPEEGARRHDYERWEPRSAQQWAEQDPFREVGLAIEQSRREQALLSFFSAWNHLPPLVRRQVWREREIAAGLYTQSYSYDWRSIPGIRFISVGTRQEGARRNLVGIVSIEPVLPEDLALTNEDLGIPNAIKVSSRVSEEVIVPVRIEFLSHMDLQRNGFVPAGQFIAASDDSPLSRSAPTLQSGDGIAGESVAGFRTPGTLTAFVSRDHDTKLMMLSAGHVMGESGWKVVANLPYPTDVGRVLETNRTFDGAIAELKSPWKVDFRLKEIQMVPAAPVIPQSDMPVQFVGAASGHQTGYINTVNNIFVGGPAVGFVPFFTASIPSRPGDSGALLVTGHGKDSPFAANFASIMGPTYVQSMTCAMLGMLIAGPSDTISAATRRQTYFMPMLSVLSQFGLQAWVRSI